MRGSMTCERAPSEPRVGTGSRMRFSVTYPMVAFTPMVRLTRK